jgi:hypothetical protein
MVYKIYLPLLLSIKKQMKKLNIECTGEIENTVNSAIDSINDELRAISLDVITTRRIYISDIVTNSYHSCMKIWRQE